MAQAKITGSFKASNGTFTITNIDAAGNYIGFNSEASDTTVLLNTSDGTYSGYASDVTILDASGLGKAAQFDISGTTLTKVTAGKGADIINVFTDGAGTDSSPLSIATGNGKDVVAISSNTNVVLTDFSATQDVIRFGTGNALDNEVVAVSNVSGKDILITLGTAGNDNNKQAKVTVQGGLGQKITIQNNTGAIIYEDTFNAGDNIIKTVTNASAGASIKSDSAYIDASKRTKALTITQMGTGVVVGGSAADSIHVFAPTTAMTENITVSGGKGADVFYIDSSTANYSVTIADYTVGDAKTADKIFLGDGLYLSTETSGDYASGYNDGKIIIYASDQADGNASKTGAKVVTLDLGTSAVWNQVKPAEAKSLVWFTSKSDLSSIDGTQAYSNPGEVVITDKNIKYAKNGTIDINDSISAVGATSSKTFSISTANNAVDTETTTIINFSNIAGPEFVISGDGKDGQAIGITGSKGKDTLVGAGAGSATNGATIDGSVGNDYIIANAYDTGTGGAGNDTLRGNAEHASVIGGAGNDVFILGGGGGYISDYNAGRANANETKADATAKKALGSDKLVVAWDKLNANGASGRYSVIFSSGTVQLQDTDINGSSDLSIAISGQTWVAAHTVEAAAAVRAGEGNYIHDSIRAGLNFFNKSTGEVWYNDDDDASADFEAADSSTVVYVAGHFGDGSENVYGGTGVGDDGSYVIKDALGKAVTFVADGVTYNQTVTAATAITTAQSFHGALAPNAQTIDGKDAKKAVRLVGNASTTAITGGAKNDTLVGNSAAAVLTGGKGADVFMGMGTIADYGDGADKILFNYSASNNNDAIGAFNDFEWADSTATLVKAGGFKVKFGTGAVTFNAVWTDESQAKLKSNATATTAWKLSEKKVTDVMVRGFGTTSSVVAFGKGSNFAFTYDEIDSGVAVLDASKTGKNTEIHNGSTSVATVIGSAKNDTIYANTLTVTDATTDSEDATKYYGGKYASEVGITSGLVTVKTGAGNDIIASGKVYITDFTASKVSKANKVTGDALYISDDNGDNTYSSDVTALGAFNASETTLDSNGNARKVQGTGNITMSFNGNDVTIGDYTLANAKGKTAYIYTKLGTSESDGAGMNVVLGTSNLATLNNLHAFTVDSKTKSTYAKGKTAVTGTLGKNDTAGVGEADVYIIDTTAITNGALVQMGNYVTEVYAGKGADTIYAGKAQTDTTTFSTGVDIYGGAGSDWLIFDQASVTGSVTYKVRDYTNDKISFGTGTGENALSIAYGEIVDNETTYTTGKKANPTVVHTSDVKLHLSNGATIQMSTMGTGTGFKITRSLDNNATALGKSATFAITYGQSDVTVGNADGATINLAGVGQSDATTGSALTLNLGLDAKRSKALTLYGAAGKATVSAAAGKAAVTYIGASVAAGETNDDAAKTAGITFIGGSKADVYKGLGASDTVTFASGNNTVDGGGRAVITLGAGNEVIKVNASDTFTLNSYTAGKDTIVLGTDFTATSFIGATNTSTADAAKNVVLMFGTDANDEKGATINLGTYDGKVTIKIGSNNNKGKFVVGSTIFQGGFGTSMTYADADGTTINAQYNPFAQAITAETGVKKNHFLTVGTNSDTKVADMVGGAGADTLVANYGVATLTGGAGNDVFQLTSDTAITITDFNTGKDVINEASLKIEDYGANYSFSGNDLIITDTTTTGATAGAVITLKGVVNSGATSAIRYKGSDDQSKNGIVLHDKTNIKLVANATKTDFSDAWFSDTVTFDASAYSKAGVKFTAQGGDKFTTFTGSKNKEDTLTIDKTATHAITAKAGSGKLTVNADAEYGAALTVELGAGGGVVNLATSTSIADSIKYAGGELTVTNFNSNDAISGIDTSKITATSADATNHSVTFTVSGKSVKFTGEGVTFSTGAWTKGAAQDSSKTNDSDTFVWSYTRTVNVGNFTYVYGTATTTALGSADMSSQNRTAYMERFTEDDLISYGDTIYSGQEGDSPFSDILSSGMASSADKAAIAVSSTDYTEVDYGTGDITFTETNVTKKTQQDK